MASYYPSFEKLGGNKLEGILSELIVSTQKVYGISLSEPDALTLGRVIKLDRGYPLIMTSEGTVRAEHAISLVKQVNERAAVGDWVLLSTPESHDKALIEAIVPRKSQFGRWSGANTGDQQVMAANVDLVLIAVVLNKKQINQTSLERMVKSLIIAYEADCDAMVLLTKADRKRDDKSLSEDLTTVKEVLGNHVEVLITSSKNGQGIEELRKLLAQVDSAVILGESGAGKTSMLNALIEQDALETQAVRERDDQGRHTTVAREMISIPNSGIIIDAPGLRSIPLIYHEAGLKRAFPEISEAAEHCKFSDCSHHHEPGCAVQTLIDSGKISELRLELYKSIHSQMLKNEERIDPAFKHRR